MHDKNLCLDFLRALVVFITLLIELTIKSVTKSFTRTKITRVEYISWRLLHDNVSRSLIGCCRRPAAVVARYTTPTLKHRAQVRSSVASEC